MSNNSHSSDIPTHPEKNISNQPIQSFFTSSFYDDQVIEKVLYEILIPLTNKEFLVSKNIFRSKGAMFYGPQGIGKRSLATIITDILQCPKVEISASEVINQSKLGKGEIFLINAFSKARKLANNIRQAGEKDNPSRVCCVIIPDLDYFAQKRNSIAGYLTSSLVNTLLSEIDAVSNGPDEGTVFIIATATNLSVIDLELRASSRLGIEIYLPPPGLATRKKILTSLFSPFPAFNDSLISTIAEETPGFSLSDLKSLLSLMTKSAIKNQHSSLTNLLSSAVSDLFLTGDLLITKNDYYQAKKLIHPSGLRDKTFHIPDVKMSDVYGLQSQKSIINENIVQFIKHKDIFEELGLKSIKGIILYGPPGNGKTLLAKAVANEIDWNFILVSGPELLSKYVGESEEQVREVFDRARLYSPCIIFFDEIDSIAPRRDKSQDTHVYASTVGQLLAEIDGIRPLDDVIIMAATNRIELVDHALLREGRIDFKLNIPLPSFEDRKEFISQELTRLEARNRLGGFDKQKLILLFCERTEGFTGAAIQFIINQASRNALNESNYSIRTLVHEKNFIDALNQYNVSDLSD